MCLVYWIFQMYPVGAFYDRGNSRWWSIDSKVGVYQGRSGHRETKLLFLPGIEPQATIATDLWSLTPPIQAFPDKISSDLWNY